MLSGSETMWSLADALGIVPVPTNREVSRLLGQWWTAPRAFGCRHVGSHEWWTVVAPERLIWCPTCARSRYEAETRCFHCGETVKPDQCEVLAVEMTGRVRVVARLHDLCAQRREDSK